MQTELKIEKWDLGALCSKDISVQVQNGDPKQLKGSQSNSITLRVWNQDGTVGTTSTSDISEGGLAIGLAESSISSGLGINCEIPQSPIRLDRLLFGEGGSRVIISIPNNRESAWLSLLSTHQQKASSKEKAFIAREAPMCIIRAPIPRRFQLGSTNKLINSTL